MDRSRVRLESEHGKGQAHLVGLSCKGMSGLAQLLAQRGFDVSGSEACDDRGAEYLRGLGITVHPGHAPVRLSGSARLLIYAPDVQRHHPNRLAALRHGVWQASSGELLDRLVARRLGIAFLGQRDASMAAAMTGWTLVQAGLDPMVILGTLVPQLGGWGRLGRGACCLVEAVEVENRLAPRLPQIAVLLNLPGSSVDTAASSTAQLRQFLSGLPRHGYVLYSDPNDMPSGLLRGIAAPVECLSLERRANWWGADLREERGRYRFRAFHRGQFVLEVRLQVAGRRQVLSALAAVAVCHRLALPAAVIKEAMEEFTGISRGLESRGTYRGVTLVDDEAQDPRAVVEVLTVCRQVFGRRRLWSVVCPEVPAAWTPFAAAFAAADRVLVAQGRGSAATNSDAAALLEALASAGVQARGVPDLERAVDALDQHLEPGDVLITLGAGDVGKVADALTARRPPRYRHAG